MKNVKIIVAVLSMSLFVGCGGGSSDDSVSAVDNSVVAEGKNIMGYYGENVILGEHTIGNRIWALVNNNTNDTILLEFTNTDEALMLEDGYLSYWQYGVSKDGVVVMFDEEIEITIYNPISSSCYDGYIQNVYTHDGVGVTLCAGD